ncbi:hypothetical protein EGY14_33660 [Burkholderia pseudomallei]|nr:hypothetical protein EGY14_33660 [Burkholderia pseudomallei]
MNRKAAGFRRIVVVAPPRVDDGAFRVLERHQFRGNDFEEQAAPNPSAGARRGLHVRRSDARHEPG